LELRDKVEQEIANDIE
jgi:hypothetical protein